MSSIALEEAHQPVAPPERFEKAAEFVASCTELTTSQYPTFEYFIEQFVPNQDRDILAKQISILKDRFVCLFGMHADTELLVDFPLDLASPKEHPKAHLEWLVERHDSPVELWRSFSKVVEQHARAFELLDEHLPYSEDQPCLWRGKDLFASLPQIEELFTALGDYGGGILRSGPECVTEALKKIESLKKVVSILESQHVDSVEDLPRLYELPKEDGPLGMIDLSHFFYNVEVIIAMTQFEGARNVYLNGNDPDGYPKDFDPEKMLRGLWWLDKADALTNFPFQILDETNGEEQVSRFYKQYGFESMFLTPHVSNAEELNKATWIDRSLGGYGIHLFQGLQDQTIALYGEYFPFVQSLIIRLRNARADSYIPDILERFRPEHFEDSVAELLWKSTGNPNDPETGGRTEQLVRYFSKPINQERYHRFPDLHKTLLSHPYNDPNSLATKIPWDLAETDSAFLCKLIEESTFFAPIALGKLRTHEFPRDREHYIEALEYWESSLWGLISAYGNSRFGRFNRFIDRYYDEAYEIDKHAKGGAGSLLNAVNPKEWASVGVQYAKRFGEAAIGNYLLFQDQPDLIDTNKRLKKITRDSRKHFGITHTYRYLEHEKLNGRGRMPIDELVQSDDFYETLDENLLSLDPSYQSDRKLAVIVTAQHDLNRAFKRRIRKQIQSLRNEGYKVLFAEAKTAQEALDFLALSVERQRQVPGEAAKGAHYLGFHFHANSEGGSFGNSDYIGDKAWLWAESGSSLRFRDYLSPDNPVVNITGCNIGFADKKSGGFAYELNQWNRGVTLLAALGTQGAEELIFEDGSVIDVDGERRRFYI